MCKRYLYLSVCQDIKCQIVIGQKHRNRYCRYALAARRLGRCPGGVRVAGEFRHCKDILCSGCKVPTTTGGQPQLSYKPKHGNDGGYKVTRPGNGCVATPRLVLPGLTRKSNSVFESAFELALNAQTRELKRDQRLKRSLETEEDDTNERLEVTSSVESQPDIADADIGEANAEVAVSFNDYGLSDATPNNRGQQPFEYSLSQGGTKDAL